MSRNEEVKNYGPAKGRYLLLGILAVALFLRLWGVGYGLPFVVHPDENRQVLDSLGMAERMSLMPEEFSYPALHKYALLAGSGVYFAAGKLLGWFTDPADFALKFLEGESRVFLIGRLLSVLAGLLVCAAVYKAGKDIFSAAAGLIGLTLSAGMFHLIQHSQWAIADIFIALFTAVALYFIILAAGEGEGEGTGKAALAFLFTGLAISTKPQGAFLAVPLAISQLYAFKDSGLGALAFLKKRLPALALFFPAALIGNLAWVFEFGAAFEKFRMLEQVTGLGISSKEPFTPGIFSLVAWFVKEMFRQEGPLGAVLVFGIVFALLKRTRQDIIFLSYLAVFMFSLKDWAIRYLHLFVAVFPALCLFGGRALGETLGSLRINRTLAGVFIAAIAAYPAAGSVEASIKKSSPDTRLIAKEWVEGNIAPGSTIAVDWYEFSIPLWSETPQYLYNPKASAYYQEKAPVSIRQGYAEFLKSRPAYRIVQTVYSTPYPNWPPEMDKDAVKAASSKEVYRELYSVFNFREVDELKKQGARFLIISSYGYTNFLLDDDPDKNPKAVFNYLFKEDLLSFNRQSDTYIEDNRFGLLYFLNKRARDFYEPLLKGRRAKLVKQFIPGPGQTGPVIKIYRL